MKTAGTAVAVAAVVAAGAFAQSAGSPWASACSNVTLTMFLPVTATITLTETHIAPVSNASPASGSDVLQPTIKFTSTSTFTVYNTVTVFPEVTTTMTRSSAAPYFYNVQSGTTYWLNGQSPGSGMSIVTGTAFTSVFLSPIPVSAQASSEAADALTESTSFNLGTVSAPAYTSTTFILQSPALTSTSISTHTTTMSLFAVTSPNSIGRLPVAPSSSAIWTNSSTAPLPHENEETATSVYYWASGEPTTSTSSLLLTTSITVLPTLTRLPASAELPTLSSTTVAAGEGSTSVAGSVPGPELSSSMPLVPVPASSSGVDDDTGAVQNLPTSTLYSLSRPLEGSLSTSSTQEQPTALTGGFSAVTSSIPIHHLSTMTARAAHNSSLTASPTVSSPILNSNLALTSMSLSSSPMPPTSDTMSARAGLNSSAQLTVFSMPRLTSGIPETSALSSITPSTSMNTSQAEPSTSQGSPPLAVPTSVVPSGGPESLVTLKTLLSTVSVSSPSPSTPAAPTSLSIETISVPGVTSHTIPSNPVVGSTVTSTSQSSNTSSAISITVTISATLATSSTMMSYSSTTTITTESTSVLASPSSLVISTPASNTSSPTGSSPNQSPTIKCGEHGPFTLNFDTLPNFTPTLLNTTDITQSPPIPNPYHHLTFSDGYVYTGREPFVPTSPPNVAVFLANGSGMAAHSISPAGRSAVRPGEITDGPYDAMSAFWFDAYNASLGCDNGGPDNCTLILTGLTWSPTAGSEIVAYTQNATLAPCPGFKNCRLELVTFPNVFRSLSGLQIQAYVGSEQRMFFMDDLNLGWSNDTCAAGLTRLQHP